MTTIIETLKEVLDGAKLSPFVDASKWEQPDASGTLSEHYGHVRDGRAQPYLRLEAKSGGAEVRAGLDGILSARPPDYGGIKGTRDLLNQFERKYSATSTVKNLFDDPLVGQPLPENIDLYVHAFSTIPRTPKITGFAYLNLDVKSLKSTLSAALEKPVFFGPNTSNFKKQVSNLDKSDRVKLLLSGLVDIPISRGDAIAEPATVPDGTTRWAGFAVCTKDGPIDPLYTYSRDQPLFGMLSGLGNGNWPLFDTSNKNKALQLTENTVLPMAVLEELRRVHELNYFDWRAVGNNQKKLYGKQLRRRAKRTATKNLGSNEYVFEFDLLDWQNIFQLEAVTEFYANYHQPWTQSPTEQDANILGSKATHSSTGKSWKRTVSLDDNTDLSDVVPNVDVIQFDEDVDRSEQAYLIVDVDDPKDEVEILGVPDFNGSNDSEWRIPTYTDVNFLNPTGEKAKVTHGSKKVELRVNNPDLYRRNLRWLWLLHENLQQEVKKSRPDWTEVVPWMPDTIRLAAVPDVAYRITDVDLKNLTLTLAENVELPSGSGSKTTAWEVSRRTRMVLVDPLAGRLFGRKATVHSNDSKQVRLEGPVPDLTRVNYDFDTLYLPGDKKGRAYRITKTPRTHKVPQGHVELHAEPDLENGRSTWSIGSGVAAGRLPPLYYNVGKGQTKTKSGNSVTDVKEYGYDHHDGGLFVIRDGRVRRWFRWNSYTGRINRVDKSDSRLKAYESSVRGNMRYEFLSWRSGKAHLNHCFRVYDRLSRHYLPKRMASSKIDTVREAGFYFHQEPGWDTEYSDRKVQSVWKAVKADRAGPSQETAGDGTDDGKTAIRIHWSPHYRPGDNARSAGCLTSPSFAGLRDELIRIHLDEHKLVFKKEGDWDADRTTVKNLLGKSVHETQKWQAGNKRRWRDRIGGVLWVVRPDQRPMEDA